MGSRGEPTEEEDAWAQCDACQKWRLLPKDHVVDEGKQWTCSLVGRSCDERADDAFEEPLKLDQFAKKRFVKDDKKHTAVVDAAIAAAQEAGHRESKDLFPYVWNATGFARKGKRGRAIHHDLTEYVRSQCAEEDRSGRARPFYDGITDIVTAEDEDLLKFLKRKDVVVAVKSCCGKTVYYCVDSGLRPRGSIAFSVDEYGLPEATRLAKLETYKALGPIEKFEKQLQKLT